MSLSHFEIISKLGEGAYSSVYKVRRISDGELYALKKVNIDSLSQKEKQNALNEVRIIASIRNPNVISYKECFLDEESEFLCIIMDFADDGDLLQKIQNHIKGNTNFKETDIWNIFIQIVKGLKSMHDLKIYHRDLKSANIFLNSDNTAKLGDFNVSKIAKKGLLYTQTGTPYYASPEVWSDQPYDFRSDIWSLGCVLYEMCTLKPPFRADNMNSLYKKIMKGNYSRIPIIYSYDLNIMIRCLLQVNPILRPSSDKILKMPIVIKYLNEIHLTVADDDEKSVLLNTIHFPKNFLNLNDRLPRANYSPLRVRKIEKSKLIETISEGCLNNSNLISENQKKNTEYYENRSPEYLPEIEKSSVIIRKDKTKSRNTSEEDEYSLRQSELKSPLHSNVKKAVKLPALDSKSTEDYIAIVKKRRESRARDQENDLKVIKEEKDRASPKLRVNDSVSREKKSLITKKDLPKKDSKQVLAEILKKYYKVTEVQNLTPVNRINNHALPELINKKLDLPLITKKINIPPINTIKSKSTSPPRKDDLVLKLHKLKKQEKELSIKHQPGQYSPLLSEEREF